MVYRMNWIFMLEGRAGEVTDSMAIEDTPVDTHSLTKFILMIGEISKIKRVFSSTRVT